MIPWSDLNNQLVKASEQRARLTEKFGEFAEHVVTTVGAAGFHLKGVVVTPHVDEGYFDVRGFGRTLRFALSTPMGDSGALIGKVQCYLVETIPVALFHDLGDFTFTRSGQTELKDPDSGDPLNITNDLAAIYLVLNFIHGSLSK